MNKEELKELEDFYNNVLALGGTQFTYKEFLISKNDKGLWVLIHYMGDNSTPIEIPGFIQVIGKTAFYRSFGISANSLGLKIPNGVIKIENSAFSGCGIKEITLPDTLQVIEPRAFDDCYIQRLFIPNSVKQIGNEAFADNEYMKFLSLPSHIKIGDRAFKNCGVMIHPSNSYFEIRKLNDTDNYAIVQGKGSFQWSTFQESVDKYIKEEHRYD